MEGINITKASRSAMITMSPVALASAITNYTYDSNGNIVSDGEFTFEHDIGGNFYILAHLSYQYENR